MKKNTKSIIYSLSLVIWTVFIFNKIKNDKQNSYELSVKYAKELYIPKGVVTEKQIDNSFGMRGASILVIDYSKYKVISKIFNIIHVGDTIQKDKNSMLFFINNKEYNYLNP